MTRPDQTSDMSSFLITLFLLPFLYYVIQLSFRKEFVVHEKGIVLISGASTGQLFHIVLFFLPHDEFVIIKFKYLINCCVGIGRHAAETLAQDGYKVYCGVRKEKDKESILSVNNPNLVPVIFDVTNHETNVEAIETIKSDMVSSKLPFVALVNNAGISRRMAAEFHDMNDIHKVFDTNVFGMMDLTQLSLPLLRESKGRIVMISSVNGKIGKFCFKFQLSRTHINFRN